MTTLNEVKKSSKISRIKLDPPLNNMIWKATTKARQLYEIRNYRGVAALTKKFAEEILDQKQKRQRNPASKEYIGTQKHRELAEKEAGDKFKGKGAPTQESMNRALPGQFETVLNMLNFVYDISQLIQSEALETTFTFEQLKKVELNTSGIKQKINEKYGSMVGYIKSARKYDLLAFDGEFSFSNTLMITCKCVGCSRLYLLNWIKERVHLIAEANDKVKDMLQENNEHPIALKLHAMMEGFLNQP